MWEKGAIMARVTVKNLDTRVEAMEGRIVNVEDKLEEMRLAQNEILSQISLLVSQTQDPAPTPVVTPKTKTKKATKKATTNTFYEEVIVARATRTPEEKAASREAAIQKATAREEVLTRRLEKALGLEPNTLEKTTVSVAQLAELGVEISRQNLKEIKAQVRATK